MVGRTAEEAEDAYLDLIQVSLSYVTIGTAIASGKRAGRRAVTLFVPGQTVPNVAILKTHGGVGEVLFRFALTFEFVQPPSGAPEPYAVSTVEYQYRISDLASQELVSYEWHPTGLSPIAIPHLHVPAAGTVVMAQRHNSPIASSKTYLGRVHFPTGTILLEDVIELLIREFAVVPRYSDWQAILARSRTQIARNGGV